MFDGGVGRCEGEEMEGVRAEGGEKCVCLQFILRGEGAKGWGAGGAVGEGEGKLW